MDSDFGFSDVCWTAVLFIAVLSLVIIGVASCLGRPVCGEAEVVYIDYTDSKLYIWAQELNKMTYVVPENEEMFLEVEVGSTVNYCVRKSGDMTFFNRAW